MALRAAVPLFALLAIATMVTEAMTQPANRPAARPDEGTTLILSVAPSPLRVGAQGTLQVQISATETLNGAVLTASAPAGLSLAQTRLTVGRVRPPTTATTAPASVIQPNPPLGVVPVRNIRLTASQPGDYDVTVTLTYDGGSISRSLTVQAR
jgi:hypothetical protein